MGDGEVMGGSIEGVVEGVVGRLRVEGGIGRQLRRICLGGFPGLTYYSITVIRMVRRLRRRDLTTARFDGGDGL